ncbi:Phosphatidylcholine transfer protein [Camellia lanceoleosa]|uniref:Phosphatidylcholine transfer protein n=1 Tax=Camellia lanceoleosa TaxID=1840588 RepID=A0ACC0GG56_9ERIC|nr:Phosphatidylcholine transfer protein [Camellia lanceoleosa]
MLFSIVVLIVVLILKSEITKSSLHLEKEKLAVVVIVAKDDLEYSCRLVEKKDGGPSWIQMMDRSTPSLSYQAWRRDPKNGPPQYRSRTVSEDATPEMVRDLFWDDDFRLKWDDMLIHAETLEECPNTGTMVVRWVHKFPFFCSDRKYIISLPCPSDLQRNKPRRIDLYYSSWYIRAVESKRGDGQLTACEVLLFHHEEMGIPWEIAKLGVQKIDPGLRAYQRERESGASLSRCAFMAQINTKVSADFLRSLESTSGSSEVETPNSSEKPSRRNMPKFLFVGGAIVLACSLDRGLLTKAVIFGVARRFIKIEQALIYQGGYGGDYGGMSNEFQRCEQFDSHGNCTLNC